MDPITMCKNAIFIQVGLKGEMETNDSPFRELGRQVEPI
jgi:hypothetical protein